MIGLLSEADRAEVAALVQDLVEGREGGQARRALRRPARIGRAEQGAGHHREVSRGAALAEVAEALAELRQEVHQRLDQEAQARQQLAAHLQVLLHQGGEGQGRGAQGDGSQPHTGGMAEIPGIGPAGSLEAARVPSQGGEGPPAPASGEPARHADPGTQGGDHESGKKAGTQGVQDPSRDPNTVHKLAQANFDLAEALNENLRNLKEIVDRSQELVARIESILRRHVRGRQGA